MTANDTKTKIWVIVCITISGCVALVAMALIFVYVPDITYATVYAGLLTSVLATITTAALTVAGLRKLTLNTNSKMDQLVEATKTIAYAAGLKDGYEHSETTTDEDHTKGRT